MAQRTELDFEARSIFDLLKGGADAYAQHWSTSVTMIQFRVPGYTQGVRVVDLLTMGDYPTYTPSPYARSIYPACSPDSFAFRCVKPTIPPELLAAIERGDTFVAHNARFEQAIWYWICHLQWGWPNPVAWSCTAARSRYWAIRASLEGSGSDLEIAIQKNADGKQFINDFCKPRKYRGTKRDGVIKDLWYEPHQNPDGWARGLQYGGDDVEAAAGIDAILPDLPPFEQKVWELDFRINTRGVPIDMPLVERAMRFTTHFTDVAYKRFDEITALRPTQRDKILQYLEQREEIETLGDLRSKTLKRITMSELPSDLQDVISIRLETSKASIKKLEAMRRCTDADGMARGTLLYGGAHTLRWTSKRLQVQNFVRGNAKAAKAVFEFLQHPCWDDRVPVIGHNGGPALDDMPAQPEWITEAGYRFPRPLGALSQSMRSFIAAPKGKKIVAGDYAQIEARVLAWLARCMWLLQAFVDKDDVYVRFGAKYMYGRDYDDCFVYVDGKRKVKEDFAHGRQVAKSAVLGCGFGLGGPKFVEYCDNSDIVISLDEAVKTVKAYRTAHKEIADYENGLWARMERAAILAVANEGQVIGLNGTGITFHVHRLDETRYWLIRTDPSGSHQAYYRPKVRLGTKFGRPCEILSFRTEWNGKSYREDTYGGKLVENAVQKIARDVMCCGALEADEAGYPLIMLVHDELVTLPDVDFGSHDDLCERMVRNKYNRTWITDLPVEAEGGTMERYGK